MDESSKPKATKSMLITDARNLHDKLYRATPSVKGAEKRSSVEATGLREDLEHGETSIHSVNVGAMLANLLAKLQEKGQFWLYTKRADGTFKNL